MTQPSILGSAGWAELAASVQPQNRSFTCPAGTTKLILFFGGLGYATTGGGSVSYNGVAMTKVVALDSVVGGRQLYVFRLDSPATGANDLVFTGWNTTGNKTVLLVPIALDDAASGAFEAVGSSESSVTTAANQVLNFTAATSIGLYGVVRAGNIPGSMAAAGSGQVEVQKPSRASGTLHVSSKLATAAGNYTFSTTISGGAAEDTPRSAIEIAGI